MYTFAGTNFTGTSHKEENSIVKWIKKIGPENNVFNVFFYNLKKGKDNSLLWSACAYSVIHIICYIIQAVKHCMNCIYIDSD